MNKFINSHNEILQPHEIHIPQRHTYKGFYSFASLEILDGACCYLWLFSLYINIKLDYQVSICSLIPPATAISKTQDRADTSV